MATTDAYTKAFEQASLDQQPAAAVMPATQTPTTPEDADYQKAWHANEADLVAKKKAKTPAVATVDTPVTQSPDEESNPYVYEKGEYDAESGNTYSSRWVLKKPADKIAMTRINDKDVISMQGVY